MTHIRKDIEGMRALAVGFVLLFHAGVTQISGGYIGVDMFFVVSGYIITSLMLREQDAYGTISLKNFWARRARRLLPLASIVIISTLLIGLWALDDSRISSLTNDSIFSSLFAANMLFAFRGGGYLTGLAPESPLLHLWSLAVEEQFYIVWPLLFVYLAKKGKNIRKNIVVTSVIAIPISLVFSIILTSVNKGVAYYILPTRLWELLAGCALAAGGTWAAKLPLRKTGACAGIGMLVYAATAYTTDTAFPSYTALVPVVGTLLLINGKDHTLSVNRLLACRPLVWFGKISYATYLLHWPMLKLWEGKYGEQTPATNLIVVLLSVPLACLSYKFFENPIRFSAKLVANPKASITVGWAVVAISLVFGFVAKIQSADTAVAQTVVVTQKPDDKTDSGKGALEVQTTTEVISADLTGRLPEVQVQTANPRVLLLGDSVLASSRWYPQSQVALEGFTYTLDAESCRRLSRKSCKGREGRVPTTVKEALQTYNGKDYDMLLILGGYHSTTKDIKQEFLDVISAAKTRGFTNILWVNYRESLKFPLTGSNGTKSAYSTMNNLISKTIDEQNISGVTTLDWGSYSKPFPEWFISDDLHTTLNGTFELNRFISVNVRANSTRICAIPGKCAALTVVPAGTNLLDFYGVKDSDTHCYLYGKTLARKCERDKALK